MINSLNFALKPFIDSLAYFESCISSQLQPSPSYSCCSHKRAFWKNWELFRPNQRCLTIVESMLRFKSHCHTLWYIIHILYTYLHIIFKQKKIEGILTLLWKFSITEPLGDPKRYFSSTPIYHAWFIGKNEKARPLNT